MAGAYSPLHASILMSGSPHSGRPGRAKSGAAMMVGRAIETQEPAAFQLAPRAYLLSQPAQQIAKKATGSAKLSGLADLPLELVFQAVQAAAGRARRQSWISAQGKSCEWKLVVEQRDGTVRAILTAASIKGRRRQTWIAVGPWKPFGTNRFVSERADGAAIRLTAAAK